MTEYCILVKLKLGNGKVNHKFTVQCVIIANSLLDTEMFREALKYITNCNICTVDYVKSPCPSLSVIVHAL